MRIACCFPDGSCLDVDPICCDDLGGVPGYVANCLGDLNTNGIDDACEEPQEREACCLPDGQCVDETPDNCIALGGTPQGAGTACTMLEGCCLQDGTCLDLDPLCCDDMGGTAQGAGTGCVDMTIACCLQDGSGACMDVDPLCCDDVGGIPGYADHCLGDNNGNGIDDACEILEACCLPDGTCIDTNYGDCVAQNGDPQGPGTNCATTICQQSKWAQPPTHNPDSPEPKCFYGWDDPSFYEMGPIVADDWPCQDNRPVTDVHWWGSYIGWEIPEPPPMGAAGFPAGFHIGIWTDVPAGVDQQWSHPGRMLWEFMVSREELNERPVGCDFHPEFMNVPDTCFKYDLFIPQDMWFYQDFDQSNIYWISISALYYEPIPIEFPWGWKTRRPEWNDDAVRIFDPLAPAIGAQFMFGEPIETSEGSWDMAFVLTTKDIAPREACCWSDGSCTDMDPEECSSNGGMPQGPGSVCAGWLEACCFEDGSCIDADPLCCSAMGGSPQGTGTMCSGEIGACCFINEYTSSCQDGMDAVCCEYLGGVPQGPGTLCTEEEACCIDETGVADNLCVMADPLCCDDMGGIPQGAGTMCTEDEACCLEDGTCVMADPLCCDELGGVAQGAGTMCTEPEGCCLQDGTCIMADPLCCDELGGTPQGAGTACVDMTIACCLDDGTCADVDPLCCDDIGGTPGYEPACLGDNNGNGIDDACEEPVIYEPKWSQRPHGPSEGFDAASGVWIHDDITGIKWQQRPNAELPGIHAHDVTDGIIILADDWLCEGGVVTDFHWWGTVEAPGMGIYGFQLSIHDNDPAGCVPGAAIWQVVIPITQIMVTPTGMFNSDGLEIFRYDYLLPEADWFYQEQGLTYWFNLSAISMDPSQPYIWRWQEAARTPLPRLCPAAGWTAPFPQMWLPIVWSDERYSDMAFVVTSVDLNPQEVNLVVADDFISDGRPIEAVRWWGSYFDDRYLPGVGVDPQRAVDGWIISFHHADPVLNPECPPDLIAGDQPPTALGLYFAPADAVEWMPLGYDDCFDHEVYEYKVDLARCCLLCSEIDPRSGFIPARRDAFHEECDFGYWLDIQAVVGAVWKTDQSGNECVLHYTNHIPSDLTVDGRFWGWHTSMDDKLNEACVGNVVDFNLNAQDCWDYGAWQKQLWECPWVPGPPVNMSFQLLTSWPTPLRIVGSWYTWKNHGAVAGELGIELDPAATGNDWHPSLGGGAGIETRRGSITKLTCTFSEPVNPVSFGVGDITICGCVNGNFNPSSISLDFTNTVLTMNFAPLTLGNGEMGSLADRYMVVISTNVTSAATGAHLSCDRDVEVIAQFGNVLNFGPSAGLTNSTDLNQISTRIGQAVPVPAPVKYDVFYIGPSAGIVNTTDYNQTSSNLTTTGPICVIPPTCP
ncbi:MAG: hypothetical protein KAV82_05705 [Phycisphaerae bacterium]|nr:hypothetical protein [Phycisphaerae bacterium]